MIDNSTTQAGVFLARPDQLLRDHLQSVSEATRKHGDKIGIGAAGQAIGLLHDIGKYSSGFQQYLERMMLCDDIEQKKAERGTVDHSTAGAQTIWSKFKDRGTVDGVVGEILALCIASHHSGLIDCISPDGTDNFSRRMATAEAKSHIEEAWANAEPDVLNLNAKHLKDPNLITELADIIKRICKEDSSEMIRRFKVGLLTRFLFSCLIDADRTNSGDSAKPVEASFRQNGKYVEWSVLSDLLEQHLKLFPNESIVDGLRMQVSASCVSSSARQKGTYTLTVPTGGGKTLASLRFALNHAAKWNMDRVIYVSPYTSIIDQNAAVVRSILEPAGTEFASVVLEHHSNLTPLVQTLKETWRRDVLSENWDAPVVFTTAVQVLEALFGSGTRAVRRMHQMANAVIIFDEIQTLPIRCVHLFNNAQNFLVEQCGSTVVLCTATPPLLHQVDPIKGAMKLSENAELMQNVPKLFTELRRNEIIDGRKPGSWEHAEVAELAMAETTRAGSCLVVVNTKREALSIFNVCKTATSDFPVFHLSTGMCPAHRLDILAEIKKHLDDRRPVICVSTQLIEAGVDISFGSAIRALAGLDSIAQTAGRCNRHGEAATGTVHIVNLKGDVPKALVDIRKAQESAQRVLDENRSNGEKSTVDLSNPELIEQYFRYYFFDRRKDMDYPVGPKEAERIDNLLNMMAENTFAVKERSTAPPIYLRQAFKTASEAFEPIDATTRGVIVQYTINGKAVINELCKAFEPKKQFGLLKQAQRFTVNVFPWVLEKLQREQAIHEVQKGTGILYLEEKYYNDVSGLNIEGSEEMEFKSA